MARGGQEKRTKARPRDCAVCWVAVCRCATSWRILAHHSAHATDQWWHPLGSCEHYLSTPEGVKIAKAVSHTLYVPAGCFVYLPAGYMCGLTFYKPPGKRGRKEAAMETATCLIAPLALKNKIEGIPMGTKRALLSWHTEATREKKAQMWVDRLAFLQLALGVPE